MDRDVISLEEAIRKHFGKSGNFDAEKGRSAMLAALKQYGRTMKRVERMTYFYLAATVAVALIAVSRFTNPGAGMKELIAWAVVFIFAIQTQMLMKLWYWVMNTRIGILREMKLGRIAEMDVDVGGEPDSWPLAQSNATGWERWGRLGGVAAVALVTLYFFPLHGSFETPNPGSVMRCEQTVALDSGGGGTSEAHFSLPNTGYFPLESLSLYSDVTDYELTYSDFLDRPVPVTTTPEGAGSRGHLDLPEPVMPGERLFLKRHGSSVNMAKLQDGVWTWKDGQSWGYLANHFDYKVTLPAGAEVISATPHPWCTTRDGGAETLHFRAARNPGEQLKIEVHYRLNEGTTGESAQ